MANKHSEESIFQKLLGSLFNGKDKEAEKKRQLKAIAKTLIRTKYKFYKPGADQVLPAFGKFFYEIYKAVAPCQLMFNAQQNPNAYKNMVVDYFLSEGQQKLLEDLMEESITSQSANMSFDELKEKVKGNLAALSAEFNQDKIDAIDGAYTKLMAFKQFCMFDFYFMLKKFDSTLTEHEFTHPPKLNAIDASYVTDNLKDFLATAWALPSGADWADIMEMFKELRGQEPIKPKQWSTIVMRLEQLRASRVFEMIIQLATKDPYYEVNADVKREQIVEAYVDKIRTQAQEAIQTLESQRKNSKTDSLLTQIFNTTGIFTLKYYTEQVNETFQRKNLPVYEYTRALSYMKAFLVEYVKRDVREYADLVLVRGKWSTPGLSQQMSDVYHQLMDLSDQITTFDSKHNEEGGEIGMKIKTILPRADRDKEARNILGTIIRDSNSIAKEYVVSGTKNLILFAKTIKILVEDYKKQHSEILSNWKELDRFAEHPIQELAVEVYKKIYLVVNLMQNLLQ